MSDWCQPDPALAAGRRGYPDAGFDVNAALEAFDRTLQPFDKMGQATITTTGYVDVVRFVTPPGNYGVLRYIGIQCADPVAYQHTNWRVLRDNQNVGGDENCLIPAIEARCGILDGTMMPFRLFMPTGCVLQIQASLTVAGSDVVWARVQGERRDDYGVRA